MYANIDSSHKAYKEQEKKLQNSKASVYAYKIFLKKSQHSDQKFNYKKARPCTLSRI